MAKAPHDLACSTKSCTVLSRTVCHSLYIATRRISCTFRCDGSKATSHMYENLPIVCTDCSEASIPFHTPLTSRCQILLTHECMYMECSAEASPSVIYSKLSCSSGFIRATTRSASIETSEDSLELIKHPETFQTRNYRRRIFRALLGLYIILSLAHRISKFDVKMRLTIVPSERAQCFGALDEPVRIPEPGREHVGPAVLVPARELDVARVLQLVDPDLLNPELDDRCDLACPGDANVPLGLEVVQPIPRAQDTQSLECQSGSERCTHDERGVRVIPRWGIQEVHPMLLR